MVIISVLYPNEPDKKFDHDYYMSTHMPMATGIYGSSLKSWQVFQYAGQADGSQAPYLIEVKMEFESMEAFAAANNVPEAAQLMEDVKNFTTIKPVVVIGERIGSN